MSAPAGSMLVAALEEAFNAWLRLDPEAPARLAPFRGKVIAIEVRGLGLRLYLQPDATDVRILSDYAGDPDTLLSGTPLALAELALPGDATRTLFSGEVEIRGDVDLGQRFKRMLDELDVDWEEQLSRLTGDVLAHKLGNLVRGAASWGRQAGDTLAEDVADYLRYEARHLPARVEVEGFLAEVDTVRSDVDRLQARVRRLAEALRGRTDPADDSDSAAQ